MSAQTETIEITGLPAGTSEAIKALSRSKGKSADEYLRTLIEAEILSEQTFAEILAPIRAGFRTSGMTEEQLDDLFEGARQKVHQEEPTNKK
jgi:predicted DNA-binding protein